MKRKSSKTKMVSADAFEYVLLLFVEVPPAEN